MASWHIIARPFTVAPTKLQQFFSPYFCQFPLLFCCIELMRILEMYKVETLLRCESKNHKTQQKTSNVSNCTKEWTCVLLHPARDRPLFTAYSALLDFSVSISNSRESLKARRARKARRTSNSSNTIEMNPRACAREIYFAQ